MPYPFLRLPNELVSDALAANGRTVSSHVFYPETVHYLYTHNFITNHSSWDSRPSSKFELFLSISVNSDWVLQWRSIGKIYWEGFTNNQYIWLQSNTAYFTFYIMENRSTFEFFHYSRKILFKTVVRLSYFTHSRYLTIFVSHENEWGNLK